MNIGTAGEWKLKWSGSEVDSRWYTTLFSMTGESASVDDPPVCNTTSGVDLEGRRARTVMVQFLSGTASYVAVYLKGIWMPEWVDNTHSFDSTNRGSWFKLKQGETMTFSLGPQGFAGNSHTPLGNCNRGIIEIEIAREVSRRTATGSFGIITGGTW